MISALLWKQIAQGIDKLLSLDERFYISLGRKLN